MNILSVLTPLNRSRITVQILVLFLVSGNYALAGPSDRSAALIVDSETFYSEENNQNRKTSKLKNTYSTFSPSISITLPFVSEAELNTLNQPKKNKLVSVGLGRDTTEPYKTSMTSTLTEWIPQPDGGKLAIFSVTSPGAEAVRLQFLIKSAPDNLEIRFFSPSEPENSIGPFGKNILMQDRIMHNSIMSASYWSPTIQGETLAVEIYLPPGTSPEDFLFSIPRLSHLSYSPLKPRNFFKNLNQLGNSGSCNIDIACINNVDPQIVSSVAKYLFTGDDGYTYICTGNLVSDTDTSTSIPYFLTAQHCVNKQSEAASAEFYWFFQRSACGGSAPSTVTRQTGGGDLLLSLGDTDMSLLKLRSPPPNGVGLSGWSSEALTPGNLLLGIHHPSGDLKKGSQGKLNDFAELFSPPDGSGPFIQLTWTSGVTEGGSSGSGVWKQISGKHYLVGTLTGGSSACDRNASVTTDYYGRFDVAFSSLKRFLAPTSDNGSLDSAGGARLLNISTNSFVDKNGIISGFIITGGNRRVIIMGESVDSQLNPVIKLTSKSSGRIIHENNNWKDDDTSKEVATKLRAPRNVKDAAFAITLRPGAYLAKISGVGGGTGKGLISVTEVEE